MSSDLETDKNIEELQHLDRHLQGFLMQKQTVQMELNEINNAIEEVKNTEDEVYKVISGVLSLSGLCSFPATTPSLT